MFNFGGNPEFMMETCLYALLQNPGHASKSPKTLVTLAKNMSSQALSAVKELRIEMEAQEDIQNLKNLRKEFQLSQKDLAKVLGVPELTVKCLELGKIKYNDTHKDRVYNFKKQARSNRANQETLREYFVKSGATRSDFARGVNVSLKTLQKLEAGKKVITEKHLDNALELCKA